MALLGIQVGVVRFGGVAAVTGSSCEVDEGVIGGLMGPNGAGKTTLFNVITGLQDPTEGRVRFDGRDLGKLPPRQRARGYDVGCGTRGPAQYRCQPHAERGVLGLL